MFIFSSLWQGMRSCINLLLPYLASVSFSWALGSFFLHLLTPVILQKQMVGGIKLHWCKKVHPWKQKMSSQLGIWTDAVPVSFRLQNKDSIGMVQETGLCWCQEPYKIWSHSTMSDRAHFLTLRQQLSGKVKQLTAFSVHHVAASHTCPWREIWRMSREICWRFCNQTVLFPSYIILNLLGILHIPVIPLVFQLILC